MSSSFLGVAAPCSASYEENLLGVFLFLLCIQTCLIFSLERTSSLSIHVLSLLQLLAQISCPLKKLPSWTMPISECYFSPQGDFYTLIGLCYNFIVNFLFSFSHPTSPSHQAIKSQKSHLPFSFKFFKVLQSHELWFLLLFCFVFFSFLVALKK